MSQTTISEVRRHILVAAFPSWGHARPLCALVAHVVKARPLIITTLLSPANLYERMEKELSRHFDEHETDIRARIRHIALKTNEQNFMDMEILMTSFADTYAKIAEERAVVCAKTSEEFAPIGGPDAAVLDIYANTMMQAVRKHSGKSVKIYGWVSCSVTSLHHFWGPSGPNKDRSVLTLIREEAERSGKSIPDAAYEIMFATSGKLVEVPGLSPMYDYEGHPQEMAIEGNKAALIHMAGAEVINGCDAIIAGTPEFFEPQETLDDLRRWFGETSREMYLVGPMLPTTSHANEVEKKLSAKSQEIDYFMDRVLREHGPKCLLYISFGSLFWPVNPEKLWAFVDVLIERRVPFIFSHASPFAKISDVVQEKVKTSGIGLLSPWSPQQSILAHPATGWFVSHCGFNSVMESIASGVPMICWPYESDQPANAAVIREKHNIAYELLEVRTGKQGLMPLYRTGTAPAGTIEAVREETSRVLEQALYGDDGQEKRANVERLQKSMAAVWSDSGSSRQELERMLDSI